MAAPRPKLIKSGGGNSSVTRTTPSQTTWADKAKEAKTRPLKPEMAEKPAPKKINIPAKDRPAKVPSGGGNSSVTRTTQPQGSWSEKAREATKRIERAPRPVTTTTTVIESTGPAETSAASRAGGTLLRGVGRLAGPVGALVGMTEEANKGEQEWIRAQQAARKLRKTGAGTVTAPYEPKRKAAGTNTAAYEPKRKAAGTDLSAYEPKRKAASTYTKSYDVKPPVPKAKPAMDKSRVAGKSKTRMAFESEFAKQRKAGAKTFMFQGKRYTTKVK